MEVLKVNNLVKLYKNNKVIDDVSFSINKGETVCIIGPSGSGKSTILRCINNLEKIDGGNIEVLDKSIVKEYKNNKPIYNSKQVLKEINGNLGMVFQDFNLFPHIKVIDNISLSQMKVLNKSKEEADSVSLKLLDKIGLKEKAEDYPCNLSGGQKQRVAIARALSLSPEILCMDEPTSALDPELVGEVLKVIKELSDEKKTMIIVTHEIAFARDVADRIIFMDSGKIIEEGDAKQVIDNPKEERTKDFLKRFNTVNESLPIKYFKEISKIPRGSANEEKIRDYLVEFAIKRNLKYYTDEYFNVIITKEADEEYTDYDTIAFQGHTDMICEKLPESNHNFLKDEIKLIIEGDYIRADKTTLGADNGIGVAMMLVLLEDKSIKTPKLECIFTTQEETTMLGVKNIDTTKITAKRIISLDSGKEGKMVVSAANCLEWTGAVDIKNNKTKIADEYYIYKLEYINFKGGHSGGNIADKTRGNPIKLGFAILKQLDNIELIDINSSGKVNVIPRECIVVFKTDKEDVEELIKEEIEKQKEEYSDASIKINRVEDSKEYKEAIDINTSKRVIDFVNNYNNGLLKRDEDGNQILSANFGNIILNKDKEQITMDFSLRSNNNTLKEEYLKNLNDNIDKNNIDIIWSQELYGFEPKKKSKLVKEVEEKYFELTGEKMEQVITQGVLEGGFFTKNIKDVEYIAIGPNTYDVHSPKEKVSISSIERTWKLIKEIVMIKYN